MNQATPKYQKTQHKGIFKRIMPDGTAVFMARIVRTDAAGKERQFTKQADSLTEAKRAKAELEEKHKIGGARSLDGERITFGELAERYKSSKVKPAEFDDEHSDNRRKIAGLKSWLSTQRFLNTLIDSFKAKRIKDITHSDIKEYKLHRLKTQSKRGKRLSIASVNRELETMRAVLNFAIVQGWLLVTPFEKGEPLISKADEVKRERILSHDEEIKLIAACTGRRTHLKSVLICLIDTAMRSGEVFKLERRDIDIESEIITVRMNITKTESKRIVPITNRLKGELVPILAKIADDPNALVFGIADNVKKSFSAVCNEAKISGLRIHDFRHTAITRMLAAGIAGEEVMKISGHSSMKTFLRYLNPSNETLKSRASQLDAYNQSMQAISFERVGLPSFIN